MQLPRGTFRTIRKNVKLGEMLGEFTSSRFTGIGTLSSGATAGTLVFKNGMCILAKIQNQYGDPAWDAVVAQPDLIADIALSDLDNAQLQLALDFNKKAQVSPSRQGSPKLAATRPAAGATAPDSAASRIPAKKVAKEREFIKTMPAVHAAPVIRPANGAPSEVVPEKKEPADGEPPTRPVQGPAEEDLDTFEDMDLDEVAQKIRKDCKIILKQLQLDHLTEK